MYNLSECIEENIYRKDHDFDLKTKNLNDLIKIMSKFKEIKTSYNNIYILYGAFETIYTDAYVNSANELLEGGGGIDEKIHEIGGIELMNEILTIPKKTDGSRIHEGEAVITNAPNFKAKKIIHTVAPYLDINGKTKPHILAKCYQSIIKCAKQNNIKNIVIPSIGTGFYGYPMLNAIKIAFFELSQENYFDKIILIFTSKLNYNIAISYCSLL